MPSLEDLIGELRLLGVLPTEVSVSRKTYGRIMEKATEVAEDDEGEED